MNTPPATPAPGSAVPSDGAAAASTTPSGTTSDITTPSGAVPGPVPDTATTQPAAPTGAAASSSPTTRGTPRSGDRSGTVRKGLALLQLLGDHPEGATAGQLVADSGLAFSTCYRLLATLVDAGYAEFEPETKRYRLGVLLFAMGQKVASARGWAGTALPVMREVVEATGESCLLAVLDGDRFLTVHTVDGPHHRTTTDPGDRGELHTSALGRVLLAFSEPQLREHLVETLDLPARTERSLTDRDALRTELERVREQGWALQDQEHDDAMAALAVPVVSPGAPVRAALALAAPVHRCDPQALVDHVPLLRQAADRLAAVLPQRR